MSERPQISIAFGLWLGNVAMFAGAIAATVTFWSSTVFAFGGCVVASPENPSLILGLLGGAVAALPLVRARLRSRRRE